MKRRDYILELSLPAAMTILAVYVLAASRSLKSAGTFPTMCAVLMLIGVLVTVVQTVAQKEKSVSFSGLEYRRALLLPVFLLLYALVLPYIGYLITTFVLCVIITRMLGYRNYVFLLLSAGLGTGTVFVLFKIILKVPLPMLF